MKILYFLIGIIYCYKSTGYVICDDQKSACPDDYQCCEKLSGGYSCCREENICCDFGKHCCDKGSLFGLDMTYPVEPIVINDMMNYCEVTFDTLIGLMELYKENITPEHLIEVLNHREENCLKWLGYDNVSEFVSILSGNLTLKEVHNMLVLYKQKFIA